MPRTLLLSVIVVSIFVWVNEVSAAQRFRMALFGSGNVTSRDLSDYTDLSWLEPGEAQQAGRRSVFLIPPSAVGGWLRKYYGAPVSEFPNVDAEVRAAIRALLSAQNFEWDRIDAVLVDEPFWQAAGDENHPYDNPCSNGSAYLRLQLMQRVLINVADILREDHRHSNGSFIRFWVNFSEPEVHWIMDETCTMQLNDVYMDVVSMDLYGKDFPSLRDEYDYLSAHRATVYQQLALVPGTYSDAADSELSASKVASRLQGFFDYAHLMNDSCSLAIGPVGVTKSADGCPVWLVAGFWGGENGVDSTDNRRPIFHSASQDILNAWRSQFDISPADALLGAVEAFDISSGQIRGWAVNRTLVQPAPFITVYRDGGIYLGEVVPDQYRSDVHDRLGIDTGSGYTFMIPAEHKRALEDSRCHPIQVFAVSHGSGSNNEGATNKQIGSTVYCGGIARRADAASK